MRKKQGIMSGSNSAGRLFVWIVSIVLFACNTTHDIQQENANTTHTMLSDTRQKAFTTDSVVIVDSVRVEHIRGVKDTIIIEKFRNREKVRVVTDTLIISKCDTLRVYEERVKETTKTPIAVWKWLFLAVFGGVIFMIIFYKFAK